MSSLPSQLDTKWLVREQHDRSASDGLAQKVSFVIE